MIKVKFKIFGYEVEVETSGWFAGPVHIAAGALGFLSGLIHPSFAFLNFIGFETYENLQYLYKKDWAIAETMEWVVGFNLPIIPVLVLL